MGMILTGFLFAIGFVVAIYLLGIAFVALNAWLSRPPPPPIDIDAFIAETNAMIGRPPPPNRKWLKWIAILFAAVWLYGIAAAILGW